MARRIIHKMTDSFTLSEIEKSAPGTLPWDFPVEKKQLTANLGGKEIEVNKFAIVRPDRPDMEPLGFCSESYDVAGYNTVLRPVLNMLSESYDPERVKVQYSGYDHGARAFWRFDLDENALDFMDSDLGDMSRFIDIGSSHDLTFAIHGAAGWLRKVCTNGLIIPHSVTNFRHVNFSGTEYGAQITNMMQSILMHHGDVLEKWDAWNRQVATPIAVDLMLDKIDGLKYPKSYTNNVPRFVLSEQAKAERDGKDGPSIWEIYNSLTDAKIPGLKDVATQGQLNAKTFDVVDAVFEEVYV